MYQKLLFSLLLSATVFVHTNAGISLLLKDPIPAISLEHIDPTLPPVVLAGETPRCSVLVLQQDFADTVGSPPAASNYTLPSECPFPWTRVILELSVFATDLQHDRVAAIWVGGAEVLRTATPRPMAPGAFWRVQKDVTRYSALFHSLSNGGSGVVSMMLENSNVALPGIYSANVSLHFYRGSTRSAQSQSLSAYTSHPTIKGLYREPADLILPVSNPAGYYESGFWFRIDNDSNPGSKSITIPPNTYRAVLEIFVSYHGDDERWYTNPLRSSYLQQPPAISSAPQENGAFRQVYATLDGRFLGGHVPYAVIYPGAINPYFWSPVAAIGAFDMPSYDLDITPFLSLMLDGAPHNIGLSVRDAQSYWLLTANLHLWTDPWSDHVHAGLLEYFNPAIKMNRNAEWRDRDGQSEIDAEGLVRFTGWVSSSKGNLTTQVRQKIKFKSQVEVQNRGTLTQIEVQNKERTTVAIMQGHQLLRRVQMLAEAPLQLQTSAVAAAGGTAEFRKARLYHQLVEAISITEGQVAKFPITLKPSLVENGIQIILHGTQVVETSTLTDRQDAEGTELVRGGAGHGGGEEMVVWGSGSTRSAYRYKDGSRCYLRTMNAAGGVVVMDTKTASCAAVAEV